MTIRLGRGQSETIGMHYARYNRNLNRVLANQRSTFFSLPLLLLLHIRLSLASTHGGQWEAKKL